MRWPQNPLHLHHLSKFLDYSEPPILHLDNEDNNLSHGVLRDSCARHMAGPLINLGFPSPTVKFKERKQMICTALACFHAVTWLPIPGFFPGPMIDFLLGSFHTSALWCSLENLL